MAGLTAKFSLVDDMSSRLADLAERGQNMISQWERMGNTANMAFDGFSDGVVSAVSAVSGVAVSIEDARNQLDAMGDGWEKELDAANRARAGIDEVTTSADTLSDTMSSYEDAAEAASMAAGTTQPTNEELIERLRAAGENTPEATQIMGELWERNIKLVRQAVHNLTGLDYGKPGFEDMEQQAYFGFHAAAYTHNPTTGYKFSTHAVNCVRWELSRYYERNGAAVRIPSAMKQRIRLCVNKRQQLEAETGRAVTNEEALKALGFSHHTTVVTLSTMKKLETVSLDAATYINGDGDDLSLLDKLADGTDVAETVLEQEWQIELRKALLQALQDVPADTRTVIVRHYFSYVKIRDMAKDRKITPQTLHNRINSAFQSIRTGRYGPELAEFMPTNSSYNRAQRLIKQDKEAFERLQLTENERGLLAL